MSVFKKLKIYVNTNKVYFFADSNEEKMTLFKCHDTHFDPVSAGLVLNGNQLF